MIDPKDEKTNTMIKRMNQKYFGKKPKNEEKTESQSPAGEDGLVDKVKDGFRGFMSKNKKWIITAVALGGLGYGILKFDSISKRENYPQRNVLYKVVSEITLQGGDVTVNEKDVSSNSVFQIYKGETAGGIVKVEDIIATAEWNTSDQDENFHLLNKMNQRIANAHFKKEKVQKGMSLKGTNMLQDQYGIIDPTGIQPGTENAPRDAFLNYRIEPERGLEEIEINALTFVNGEKRLVNKMTEMRGFPLGLFGDINNFRAGTKLDLYTVKVGDARVNKLFSLVENFNKKLDSLNREERYAFIQQILEVEKSIPKKIVYRNYEDGIIDANFQESTVYLGFEPTWAERTMFNIGGFFEQAKERLTLGIWDKSVHKDGVIRIENRWNLWPGNILLLNKLKYNTPKRTLSLFDKTNNGGYVLIDNKGRFAEVRIKDFLLHYDKDVVYQYFLDKNGDGKIDREKELIGEVLHHRNYGKLASKKDSIGIGKHEKDVSDNREYSFMGGYSTDDVERHNDFRLCTYLETLMVNETNRGTGKHSILGDINEARGYIMLFNEPNFVNLSRALTYENSLVASHDILKLLEAAKRPYAIKFAELTGQKLSDAAQQKNEEPTDKHVIESLDRLIEKK